MGTKTFKNLFTIVEFCHCEKRIPIHGDENMFKVISFSAFNILSEKRIPIHGDENYDYRIHKTG